MQEELRANNDSVFTESETTATAVAHIEQECFQPVVPASLSPTEISIKVVVLAIILSVVLAAANAYLGLFSGITISVSIPSSILSLTLLRPFRANILEINAVQTGVSAGSALASGIIYTIPGLLMLGQSAWTTIHFWETFLIALIGGLIGVLFTIPLRRAMIVENSDHLEFPEGKAITEVLKVTCLIPNSNDDIVTSSDQRAENNEPLSDSDEDSDVTDTDQLLSHHRRPQSATEYQPPKGNFLSVTVLGIFCGVFMKFCQSGLAFYAASIKLAWSMFSTVFYLGLDTSPALIGVGYIVKLRVALVLFLGGLLNSWLAIPIIASSEKSITDASATYHKIFQEKSRFIGVGCMVVGGIVTFAGLTGSLVSSFKSSYHAVKQIYYQGMSSIQRTDRDIPLPISIAVVLVCFVPIFILFMIFTEYNFLIAFTMSLFVIIAGFMFSSVSAYVAGLVGSSNNPISGVTIATILTASFILLLWLGKGSPQGPLLSILIGSVVCCAASIGGDNMQDLKTGHLLGATPWKIQVMQIIGLILPAVTLPWILKLLSTAYGFGIATDSHPHPLPAPQASLMASVTNSIFFGSLPLSLVGIGFAGGAIVFILNLLIFELLLKDKTDFRVPVLALALGFYIPFELTTPIFIGAIAEYISSILLSKVILKGCNSEVIDAEKQKGSQYGLLYCAGLITGESICGILLAIPIVISRKADIMAIFGTQFLAHGWPGALLLLIVIGLLIYLSNEKAIAKRRALRR